MDELRTDPFPEGAYSAPPRHVARYGDWQVWGQWCLLAATWGLLAAAFWGNDGLWFQGDSPRHALNGVFWGDLVKAGTLDPISYAWSYFARYPALTIRKYPPVYHLLSAVGYAVFGLTPWVPKGLSLLSGLALGTWVWHWLRRWVAPEAGWLAATLYLMPGITIWMHAGMTNMLATALAMGALYHLRRALEEPLGSRQLTIACLLAALAVLSHPLAGIVIPVGMVWIVQERRLKWILRPAVLKLLVIAFLLLIPVFVVLYFKGGNQFWQANIDPWRLINQWALTFYADRLPGLIGIPLLVGMPLTLLGLLWRPRESWKDCRLIVSWLVICIVQLILIWAKDNRYALICLPAFLIVMATGCREWIRHLIGPAIPPRWRYWIVSAIAVLAVVTSLQTCPLRVPEVRGMPELARTVCEMADGEPVFYHGQYDGVLIYYTRLNDPGFRQQVIPFELWLGPHRDFQGCTWMLKESGVRWLLIERDRPDRSMLAPKLLATVTRQPWVQHRGTLSFRTSRERTIDVYELQPRFPHNHPVTGAGPEGISWKIGPRMSTPIARSSP